MPCSLTRSGEYRSELFGSSYKDTVNLPVFKFALKECYKERSLNRESLVNRINEFCSKRKWSYGERTGSDYVKVAANLRLLSYDRKASEYQLSPLGKAWIALDDRIDPSLTDYDRMFFLRHILYIDSHNCGMWLCLILSAISDTSMEASRIYETYANNLSKLGLRLSGEAKIHKTRPVLQWGVRLGILSLGEGRKYQVTSAGHELVNFFCRLQDGGLKAFWEEASGYLVQCFIRLGLSKKRREVDKGIFEDHVLRGYEKIIKVFPTARAVEIPSLRSFCIVSMLKDGFPVNCSEFDFMLKETCFQKYTIYELLRSAERALSYPFQGIEGDKGSFYYFKVSRQC